MKRKHLDELLSFPDHCCVMRLYVLQLLALEEVRYTCLTTTPPCIYRARVIGKQLSSEHGR